MPLFLDSHILPAGITADDVAEIHAKDLMIQASHGVQMVKYWYDAARGRVFCLVVAPVEMRRLPFIENRAVKSRMIPSKCKSSNRYLKPV